VARAVAAEKLRSEAEIKLGNANAEINALRPRAQELEVAKATLTNQVRIFLHIYHCPGLCTHCIL
jgi:hypothetical protein